MSEYDHLLYEQRGLVTLITINRPERMNAIGPQTHRELIDAWNRFRADDTALVGVVTGQGRPLDDGLRIEANASTGRSSRPRPTKAYANSTNATTRTVAQTPPLPRQASPARSKQLPRETASAKASVHVGLFGVKPARNPFGVPAFIGH